MKSATLAAAISTLLAITAHAQVTSDAKEMAVSIVEACVDADGKLVSARIFESSGFPEIDDAALKVARANKYSAGTEAGKKKELSCTKFKVKFVIKDDKSTVKEQATTETPAAEIPPVKLPPPAAPGS